MGNEKNLIELEPKLSANYLRFECPICINKKKDDIGYGHCVIVRITKSKEIYKKTEHTWLMTGDTIENITLHPSILADTGDVCRFHGWVKKGVVQW